MNETHPPRVAEAVLDSFGAAPEFRDAIIGDLAQEHAVRVEKYGAGSARLWYYREAAAAVPHLLRHWMKGARAADWRRLAQVVVLAYFTNALVQLGIFFVAAGVWNAGLRDHVAIPTQNVQLVVFGVVAMLSPIMAGYFAASYEKERPMIAAAALAFVWAVFVFGGAVVSLVAPATDPLPLWMLPPLLRLVIIMPLLTGFTLLGGALKVRHLSLEPTSR